MPVAADTKQRPHDQLCIQHAEFRGIIPVCRGKNVVLFGKDPGKDHLRRHIGIQPVILTDDIQAKQEQKRRSQQNIWYLFFQCFHTADLSVIAYAFFPNYTRFAAKAQLRLLRQIYKFSH